MQEFRAVRRVFVLATVSLVSLSLSFGSTVQGRLDPLPHQAYVWQRSWSPAVREAVQDHGASFQRLAVLAAEVSWKDGRPRLVQVPLDYPTLRAHRAGLGLALRIGPYPGPFRAQGEPLGSLIALGKKLVEEWESHGLAPAEVQLDFDCAESKLAGYETWVTEFKRSLAPIPLTITALPSWLRHAGFSRLVAATDGYVLQVHSLERPRGLTDRFDLCEPEAARRAVEQAGRLSVPFRVALPTYGYVLAFDGGGKFVGLSAEVRPPSWPSGYQIREVHADPEAIAGLVRHWSTNRPPGLAGVIWYRLPVAGDRLNWPWHTLRAVMGGRLPRAECRSEASRAQPGLLNLELINDGEAAAPFPTAVKVRWKSARLIVGDGLGGYRMEGDGARAVRLMMAGASRPAHLNPGERRTIGWVRLSSDEEIQIEISKTK